MDNKNCNELISRILNIRISGATFPVIEPVGRDTNTDGKHASVYPRIRSLLTALTLQFRLHYHTFGSGLDKESSKLLRSECEKLNTEIEGSLTLVQEEKESFPIIKKILHNILGILYYFEGDYENAITQLNQSKKLAVSKQFFSFDTLLNVENLYYTGLTLVALNKLSVEVNPAEDAVEHTLSHYYARQLMKILHIIPDQMQGYIHSYLDLIAQQLHFDSLTHLFNQFNAKSPLVCYLSFLKLRGDPALFERSAERLDKELLEVGNSILHKAKFPMASESNNDTLEQFHMFLQYYFKQYQELSGGSNIPSEAWKSFIVESIRKTFQSVNVARSATFYFAIDGSSKDGRLEAILNFNNSVKYTALQTEWEEEEKLNDDGSKGTEEIEKLPGEQSWIHQPYFDYVSAINSYTLILTRTTPEDNVENIYDYNSCCDKLLTTVKGFYKLNNLPLVSPKESLDYTSNSKRLVLPASIAKILRSAWVALYKIRENDLRCLTENLLLSYLANTMSLYIQDDYNGGGNDSNNNKTDDSDAISLLNLQFQYASTLAKQRHIEASITYLESQILESNPTFYDAWHLLALCRSVQDDKESSYKIISSVLDSIESADGPKTLREKLRFINLKITEIYIVDEIFGRGEALDLLPDLFSTYNALFDTSKVKSGYYDSVPFKRSPRYLLQCIWLCAATFYLDTDEHLNDAKDAIREAQKLEDGASDTNLEIRVANGYLLMKQGKLRQARKEFEGVLYQDSLNTEGIIGLGKLTFFDDIDGLTRSPSERELADYVHLIPDVSEKKDEKNPDTELEPLFVNDGDRLAMYGRLKLLLDCAIIQSIEAYNSPEIWWYLSLIHEKFENPARKDTLLMCIKSRENLPLREFSVCQF